MDGQLSGTIFVRTWFGEKNDIASQEAANAAYKRLLVYVMQQGDPNDYNTCMDPEFIYDKKEEFFGDDGHGVSNCPDIVDGIALGTPGSVPSYVVTALMHCPDQFDPVSDRPWRHHSQSEAEAEEAEQDTRQKLLVLVADKKACEDGWVLHLALNHKAQVLPFKIRGQSREVSTIVANWMEGQALEENTDNPDENVVLYMPEGVYTPECGGWD